VRLNKHSAREGDRLDRAAEIAARVDRPQDTGWDDVWLAELERRTLAAQSRGTPAPEWAEARSRILSRLPGR